MDWVMVILVCMSTVPHDQCNENTATATTKPIGEYSTQAGCATAAMTVLPQIQYDDGKTFAVVQCKRFVHT